MLKIYGNMNCCTCVQCRKELDEAGVPYTFLDLADCVRNIREFLAIRDKSSLFDEVKAEGRIGIPCILQEDGTVTLSWDQFLPKQS